MRKSPKHHPHHIHIAIAGCGLAGIGMAIRLIQEKHNDFIVFEREKNIGGVWRDNTYPGCAVDVESSLYQYSFALNPEWSHCFAPQPEVLAYLQDCANRFGVIPHVRFEHAITEIIWEEKNQYWRIETSHGIYTADVFIDAMGSLNTPVIPDFPGLNTFLGKTFHSSHWDHTYDLKGRHVAVIGTGASAIQIVPNIQPKVGKLSLFERTPPWIIPRLDYTISPKKRMFLRKFPFFLWLLRKIYYYIHELVTFLPLHPRLSKLVLGAVAYRHLKKQITDPILRKKLTPTYTPWCKRFMLSNEFYSALTHENVEVITNQIQEIKPDGIVTADGMERKVDAIIFATGFDSLNQKFANHIRGRNGQTLAEAWHGSPHAYLGLTIPHFPNFFFLLGPSGHSTHNSLSITAENQMNHIVHAIDYIEKHHISAIEIRPEVESKYLTKIRQKLSKSTYMLGGCRSFYNDVNGYPYLFFPGFSFTFKRLTEPFKPKNYLIYSE